MPRFPFTYVLPGVLPGMLLAAVLVMVSIFPFDAVARVGVTSATDGDPTGKPPQELERILRVGIDVVADELITTHGDDRAHLIFLDGTSLTVSPNAELKIDRFVYDPATQVGDIAISATKGVFRLVGGKISKASAITVQTPSATMGLRGGISLFAVDQHETAAQFLFGKSLVVTAAGRTETAFRAGTEIRSVFGGPPGLPTMIGPGALLPELKLLEAASNRGSADRSPDTAAKQSGFSDQNSGRALVANAGATAAVPDTSNIVSQAKPQATAPIQATAPTQIAAPPMVAPPPPPPPPPATTMETWHHHHHPFFDPRYFDHRFDDHHFNDRRFIR